MTKFLSVDGDDGLGKAALAPTHSKALRAGLRSRDLGLLDGCFTLAARGDARPPTLKCGVLFYFDGGADGG
jgi:hypothetical protein